MDTFKDRMYKFETTPPAGVWDAIASQLDGNGAKVIPLQTRSSKRFYYIAAASIAIILLCIVFFTQRSSNSTTGDGFFSSSSDKQNKNIVGNTTDTSATAKNGNPIITVPEENKNEEKSNSDEELLAKNESIKGGPNAKVKNDKPKKNDSADNKIIATNSSTDYITIEGPQGQPVKISTKMATLIDSSDQKVPPKPSWNKKINEWREIMKGNTLAPTPGNFLDIIELTKTLKDHNKP